MSIETLRRHHTHTSPTGKQLFLGRAFSWVSTVPGVPLPHATPLALQIGLIFHEGRQLS